MKWPRGFLLVALASLELARGRGLKSPKSQQGELRGVAQQSKCEEQSEVLRQEITDLRKKMQGTQSDNANLVETLRRMMSKNSTKIFQRQAERAEEMKVSVEMRCAQERKDLEAQLKDMAGKCDASKEEASNLHEDNAEMLKKLQALQADLAKVTKENKELAANKVYLVSTMQGLMRDNSKFKEQLGKVQGLESKEAKEISADKATIAKDDATIAKAKKATKKPQQAKKQQHQQKKPLLGNGKAGADNSAALHAHIREVDKYIDHAEAPPIDDVEYLKELQQHEDTLEKGQQQQLASLAKKNVHLSEWLGLDPEKAAMKVSAPEAQTADDDSDPGAEAAALLREAKAQLDA
jgi:hypothetical protein